MPVIPEEVLLGFLKRCVEMSADLLPRVASEGSRPVPAPIAEKYEALIADIHAQKRHDSVLSDESWEWIWETKPGSNAFQIYGRLAWLNYNLFDLL